MSGPSFIRASCALALVAAGLVVVGSGCTRAHAKPLAGPLRVAAAADLALAFKEVGDAYEKESGQKVIFSFGSTGLLAKQIEQGAPFDLFAAANLSFADEAIKAGACLADSRALYARGRIVLWARAGTPLPKSTAQLLQPEYKRISIANPAHAPYGRAAVQAMEKAGVYATVKPRLVFGENVQQALQFAQSGNAEVAVVALSLAVISDGQYTPIPEGEHLPIDQALVVCGDKPERIAAARAFTAFVNGDKGRAVMRRFGFLLPGESASVAQQKR